MFGTLVSTEMAAISDWIEFSIAELCGDFSQISCLQVQRQKKS
jgi:hypothetical protein